MTGLILLLLIGLTLLLLSCSGAVVWYIVRPRRKTYAIALAQGLPTDPADLDLVAQTATFTLPDKHTTPGWIITGQNADGPTVLILHGHNDARFGSLLRAAELAPYAAHLVVFDWPAHGECTAPWMTCGTREPNDLIAVLDGLPDPIRNKPLVLFGYSIGAQIAAKTAGLYPRFVGVILDGPYQHWDSPIRMRLKRYEVPAFPLIHIVGAFFHLTGLIRDFDRAQFTRKIHVPLLVLHGSDDRVCPPHEGKALSDAAKHGRFVLIEGGKHNRLHEHDRETYHTALQDFFHKLSS